jgi:hypothetical protein
MLGIIQLIDPFYVKLPYDTFRRASVVGQFCWIPVTHLDPIPRILDVERADPQEHYATKFSIRNMTDGDFKKKTRLPIKALSLRETEELVIHRAKRRPAIIISGETTIFDDIKMLLQQMRRKHLQEENLIVAPLYSVESGDHEGGFPPVMVARIRALMYKQFFFCPRGNSPLTSDSIMRLDRVHAVIPNYPAYIPEPYSLSTEALGVLMAMLRSLFGAKEEADFEALKELVFESLPDEAKLNSV